jgi:hypothetical protein
MAHLSSIRRLLVLALLAVWWGGFTFYALGVIPSGHQVLHSRVRQGFITQRVTVKLNLLGAVTLAVALTEVLTARSQAKRFRLLLGAWLVCVAAQAALFHIHVRMDALLDATRMTVTEQERFESLHLWYLWAATIGWAGGGVMLLLAGSPAQPRRARSDRGTMETTQ